MTFRLTQLSGIMGLMARPCTLLFGLILAWCPCAFALNPSLEISQYAHKAWTIRDGFFKGTIDAIAQTPDGYLWLGTEFGLLRFDGVRSVPWQPPAGERLPSNLIISLLVARDGRLWIGTDSGLAGWKDGKLAHYPALAGQFVLSLHEDREGVIWAGAFAPPTGRLCAIRNTNAQCYGEDGSFGKTVLSLYEGSDGILWAGTSAGLWRWKPGPPKLYPTRDLSSANGLTEDGNGVPLIAARSGIIQLVAGKLETYALPGPRQPFAATRLLRDREGGLWIGTLGRGLLHVRQGKTDVFARSDGLSGDGVSALYEDHEGNIWVATADGLDRFRDFAVPTISAKQGLSDSAVWSVLTAGDGSVWLGTRDGLNRWHGGQITIRRKRDSGLGNDIAESLFQDDRERIWVSTPRGVVFLENDRFIPVADLPGGVTRSIAGDHAGNLWISYQDQGLFHLRGGSVVERIPWARLGRKDWADALLADPVHGGLWLGFFQSGVAYLKDGQIRASHTSADGLGDGRVDDLEFDGEGTLWVASEGGLSRVKNGHVATLTTRNGLPCAEVHWAREDNDHSFWLYTACGLVRVGRSEMDAWAADPKRTIQAIVFDSSDGVRSRAGSFGFSPGVARSADGKLWFLPGDGVSVVDPRHLSLNKLPPAVHIEEVKVDGKVWDQSQGWRLPALIRDVTIRYTALSFAAPEKAHFRYKLEGQDPDWKEVVNEREAPYTNLKPRNYRFRVMASNNSGVWNETGDTLAFSIAPTFYQTNWFGAWLAAVFVAILWGLYRLRLYQVAREFSAQTGERARIARDLHDTLLQSFHASLIQMQTARNVFPRRFEEGIQTLDNAIGSAEQAIDEGRRTIQDLRATAAPRSNLECLLTAAAQELAEAPDSNGTNPVFDVTVEGTERILAPDLQDEVYRIGREVLRNAFRHAHAGHIEAEIRYDKRNLRMRIRDDGKGIDRHILEEGAKAGHWGLPGIRERTKRIGGEFDIWSEAGAGTEIELTVPASKAYAQPQGRSQLPVTLRATLRRFGLFRKKTG
jgi:signal transduction histidine kinase/ligand-binding sensor domain-containing protein